MPTILVTDASRGSAISIIRSIGRRGWRVIAADCDPRSPGFRSRYVQQQLIYPPPRTAPLEFVNAIVEAVQRWGIDLIIPVTDEAILPLADVRAQFSGRCQLTIPEALALECATNKRKTLELAERVGVPAPRTVLVHTARQAVEASPALGWPVVLKPCMSRLYRNRTAIEAFAVSFAQNLQQLEERMLGYEGRCPVLLQEYCEGAGHGVNLLMHQGSPLACFQHKRLHEFPLSGGVSTLRESVPLDAALYGHAVRLLAELRWTGLAMVEFKVGRAGPVLMEINGRVWGSLPLAVLSGMDFPRLLAELYLCGPPAAGAAPQTSYAIGVRSRNLRLELKWIAQVLRRRPRYSFMRMPTRRQGLAAAVGLLNPACKFDILSLDDPGPGLRHIARMIGDYWRRPTKSVQPSGGMT